MFPRSDFDHERAVPDERSVRSAAIPVSFSRTLGLFMPGAAHVVPAASAVLFLSPWGFEEMCTRKLWRELAERFADAGIASLRFDYPGTGDSLDGIDFSSGLRVWEDAIVAAATELSRLSGRSRLILVGHGLGATLAAGITPRLNSLGTGIQAVAMIAPVVSGRMYLRELAAWSKMVDAGLGLSDEQRIKDHVSVAGLVMPDEIAAALKILSIEALPVLPAPRLLVIERPGRDKDRALAAHFKSLGADVSHIPYTGYDELVSNPTIASEPIEIIEKVSAWIRAVAAEPGGLAADPVPPEAAVLSALDYFETPVRFGENNRLFGVLCSPHGERRGATVIQLGTAYDRETGWARSSVEAARGLAAQGVVSLRFDAANVGDSPPLPSAPPQVLFSDGQIDDVRAALDLVDGLGLAPAMLVGRCSGAFLAFRSAVGDERCKAAVVINPFTFVWDKDESVEDALRYNARSLEDYGRRVLRLETFRRLGTGRVDIPSAVVNIATQIVRRLLLNAPPFMASLSKLGRLREATHAAFRRLAERGMPVFLIYSGGDIGLDRYYFHFGANGKGLKRYPNVSVEIVQGADHNMTPPFARTLVRERLLAAALKAGKKAGTPEAAPFHGFAEGRLERQSV